MPNKNQSETTTKYHKILKDYWGFDSFRDLQLDIISAVGEGQSALALMPTGGGKSITFQVPALAKEGICLVVSPLIALMKDQVENLRHRGIKAAAIYSGMTHEQILTTLENCEYGNFKFLYVSPERLSTELFQKHLNFLNISMLAVDEAHCISQWGYDFRPQYLKIADILEILTENTPVLALTATATPLVVDDIQEKLKFPQKNVFQKSFERKNLNYVVRHTENKFEQMLRILNNVKGSSIVYVRSRLQTKEISDFLNKNHIKSDFFHAGLPSNDKNRKQDEWKSGKTRVIVATNAFGMGIDKSDVRSVIHTEMPDSLEAYFQEAGRAGRDEQTAYATLLYNKADGAKLKRRIPDKFPTIDFIQKVYQNLANHFTLAVGAGFEAVYAFNLQEFCFTWKLPQNPTYNALKILEMAGYIELTEELDNPSVLRFIVEREKLYSFRTQNPAQERLIETLLRSYTGLFSSDVHINEDLIAERLDTKRDFVYENLKKLSAFGIIKYIPFKKTPLLIYTLQRIDTEKVIIPKSVYDERKERYKKQIEAVLDYAENLDNCLVQKLLRYFGETNTKPCGVCSVCREKRAKELSAGNFQIIEEKIYSILQNNPLTINELTEKIKTKQENIIAVARKLLDEGKIFQNIELKLSIKY
ncbi:MAG: RecQ family ATP-dependent DNA helicase [Prevotellaceae bacterium]|nr:RecQ family ATP-dependent DNA helicase [Prevotellaceae bacterium]